MPLYQLRQWIDTNNAIVARARKGEKGEVVARKEWELLFNLSAKQNSNFSSTFKAAQSALVETQNRTSS